MEGSRLLLDKHLAQTTLMPLGLSIERAQGIYLYTTDGRRFTDMVSGIGVSNLGHGHPRIVQAIKDQADKHLHVMVYGEFLQEAQSRAAELLSSMLPSSLDCCYFVNSGTEANEAALKLARRVTGRSRIVSCKGAYHGNSLGSLSISSNETKKAPFRPLLPDIHFMRFNEMADLWMIDHQTAGVFVETIQGDAGIRIPSVEWMQALRQRCTEVGALLILDEIQCGMGRSGTFAAFTPFGIVPDVLTLGKALGGGLPVGCVVASRALMEQFAYDPMLGHISTFAGHPLVCAAVAASLEVYRDERVVDRVEEKGRYFAERLRAHPAVKEVRQRGLYMAIDLESADHVQRVVDAGMQRGLITFWFLSCPWSFRIAPPLVISDEEMHEACDHLLAALDHA